MAPRKKPPERITDPVLLARRQVSHLSKEDVGENLDKYRRPFRLERVSRAFFQNLPGFPANYVNQQWYDTYQDAVGPHSLGTFQIPNSMVLDLASIEFVFLIGNPLDPTQLGRAHDWYLGPSVRFFMRVNGTNPWDQGFTQVGTIKDPISGFVTLNNNIFTTNDDVPFHLVIEEDAKVEFLYDRAGPSVGPPVNSKIGAEIKGRWIPQAVWNDMKEDLR